MKKPQDIYRQPSLATITAFGCVAGMLFCISIIVSLSLKQRRLSQEVEDLRHRLQSAHGASSLTPAALPAVQPAPAEPVKVAPRRTTKPLASKSAPAAGTPETARAPAQTDRPLQPEPAPIQTAQLPAAAAETPAAAETTPAAAEQDMVSALRAPDPEALAALAAESAAVQAAKPAEESVNAAAPREASPPAATDPLPGTLQGKILAANHSQNSVILSLGSTAGIQPGTRFNVYRENRWVGDIRVARVFREMSKCDVKTSMRGGIRVEDMARAVPAGQTD